MAISVHESQIGSLFVGYFNRSADPAGLAYWVGQLNNGMPLTSIAQSFSVQPEATALYPFLTDPTLRNAGDFVVAIYRNLFNREVDDAGLAWWVFELGLGRQVGPMILNIISGALHADLRTINNKSTVAVEYAQAFDAAHRSWTPADLASSRSVLSGVTSDPATVTAAETKIHDIVNPTLPPPPPPPPPPEPVPPVITMNLKVAGDQVALNGTTGTLTLLDADLSWYPSSIYGTVQKVAALGFQQVNTTATATLSAAGNSAATTFNFGTGVVGGTDAVNGRLIYTGFTKYVASAHGDTVTMTATGQSATGGASSDTFKVTGGTVTISEVGKGGSPQDDVVVVSAGATANVSTLLYWVPTAATSNNGTASIESNGANVFLTAVTGTKGWTITNSSPFANNMAGSPYDDVMIGNAAVNTLVGGGGNDKMTGGGDVDHFIVDAGTVTITDLGAGGADSVQVYVSGATVIAKLVADWTPDNSGISSSNNGTANIDAGGFNVNLSDVSAGNGWNLTNTIATGITMVGSALGDTITGNTGGDTIDGGGGNDSLNGGGGTDSLTGGTGIDTFTVTAGTVTITDLAVGGEVDALVASGGTVSAKLAGIWLADAATDITGGTVAVNANGFTVNVSAVTGSDGWTLTNGGGGAAMTGGSGDDVISGGTGVDSLSGGDGNDTLNGAAGADTLSGGSQEDTFVFTSRNETHAAGFSAIDTDAANVDKISDFSGNGAGLGDVISLGTGASAFGSMTFMAGGATTANVTTVTVATADDFDALFVAAQADSGGGVASSNAVAQIYDVTVGPGNLEGRWLIINDFTGTLTASDSIIRITGITGALHNSDFVFA